MTIGVAAYGNQAGAAVYAAVLGAELIGRGAIGGFAVFAILDTDGKLHYRCIQDGGVTALDLPEDWFAAKYAAAISSGPNRPEPLVQFLAGSDGCALVTGHRLPNSACADGTPVNIAVLERLEKGEDPQAAIDAVLDGHPEIDAGLIALTSDGRLGCANSARVKRRTDLGAAFRAGTGCGFALLHNSIFFEKGDCQALGDALAGLVWHELTGTASGHEVLQLGEPVRIELADRDRLHVDLDGNILAIETTDRNLLTARRTGTTVYLGSEIWRDGNACGYAANELVTRMEEGTACPRVLPVNNRMMMRVAHVPS